jgi:hypothetical protein
MFGQACIRKPSNDDNWAQVPSRAREERIAMWGLAQRISQGERSRRDVWKRFQNFMAVDFWRPPGLRDASGCALRYNAGTTKTA